MITPRKSAASRPSVPPPVGDGKRTKARRGGSGHKSVSAFIAMASLCEEEEELAEDEIEIEEGETLEELKARMQSMKPKKPTFSADMLDTANSYDDKVALIRMLVSQESGRVAMVLKNMVKS